MGNRDINKMRLAAELSDSAMAQGSEQAFQAWWDPKAPSLTKYLSSKGRLGEDGGQVDGDGRWGWQMGMADWMADVRTFFYHLAHGEIQLKL